MKKDLLSKLFIAMMVLLAISCKNDRLENDVSEDNEAINNETINKVLGTWQIASVYHYDSNGTLKNVTSKLAFYVTLTKEPYDKNPSYYLCITDDFIGTKYSAKQGWTYSNKKFVGSGYLDGDILISINSLEMKTKRDDNDGYRIFVFERTNEPEHVFKSGGGDNDGSGSEGEPPYVTGFDFTATRTSITVKFMCNERPTSATVKYGISSPVSTVSSSISGKQVSATVTGLNAGTTYKFKCTVKNSYGSSTSDTYSTITNF